MRLCLLSPLCSHGMSTQLIDSNGLTSWACSDLHWQPWVSFYQKCKNWNCLICWTCFLWFLQKIFVTGFVYLYCLLILFQLFDLDCLMFQLFGQDWIHSSVLWSRLLMFQLFDQDCIHVSALWSRLFMFQLCHLIKTIRVSYKAVTWSNLFLFPIRLSRDQNYLCFLLDWVYFKQKQTSEC